MQCVYKHKQSISVTGSDEEVYIRVIYTIILITINCDYIMQNVQSIELITEPKNTPMWIASILSITLGKILMCALLNVSTMIRRPVHVFLSGSRSPVIISQYTPAGSDVVIHVSMLWMGSLLKAIQALSPRQKAIWSPSLSHQWVICNNTHAFYLSNALVVGLLTFIVDF